jgi:uncharacterized membrane protein YhaH (DUF805 family)
MERFFKFDGYVQRSEYWATVLIIMVAGFFLGFGLGTFMLFEELALFALLLLLALMVVAIWISLAVTAKRCRDAGISPYWCLVMLVPYVSFVATIVFGVIPTDPKRVAEEFE